MTVSVPPTIPLERRALWEHIFGEQHGLLAVWSGQRVDGQKELADPTTRYYRWPEQAQAASRQLDRESEAGREAYFCAHLLTARQRIKANAAPMLACYVDADGAVPGPDHPPPTGAVESSPGRFHFWYRLTRAVDPKVGEQLNRRLAHQMQADMSGWDLTQVLRAPGTQNWKYSPARQVRLVSIEDHAHDPDELDRILPQLPEASAPRTEVKLSQQDTVVPIDDRDARALEKMYASKRGPELQTLMNGGSLHKKPDGSPDHSADDQSSMNGLAFWLDKDPARMARAFRAGRDRPKLDEVHSANGETYLEMTIGTAISGCRQTFRELTGYDAGDEPQRLRFTAPAAPVTVSTTAGAGVAGAEACPCNGDHDQCREIAEYRQSVQDVMVHVEYLAGLVEDQQAIIRAQRAELDDKTAFLSHVTDVLAKPNTEMSSTEKVVGLALAYETHYRASRGRTKLPLIALVERTGLSKNTVSTASRALTEREGSPFERRVTREWRDDERGGQFVTTIEFRPRTERTEDTLRAIAAMPAEPDKPKHGGSEQASAVRWGRCEMHDNREVRVRGYCPSCGRVVGERTVSRQEFDLLNHQDCDSENPPPRVDVLVPSTHNMRDPAVAAALDTQDVDSASPRSLADYAASRPEDRLRSLRCTSIKPNGRECRSLEFRDLGGGRLRCLGCAAQTVPVMIGAAE